GGTMADARPSGGTPSTTPAGVRRDRRRTVTGVLANLGLGVGAALVVALPLQFFVTYFAIGYTAVATPAEENRYLVTATACLVLLVGGTVAAAVGRRWVRTGLGVALTVLALVVALLLPVPSGRWFDWSSERSPEQPYNTVPQCRSGGDSDDC